MGQATADVAPTGPLMASYDQRRLRDLLGDKGILFHFFVGPDDTFVSFSSQGLLDHYRLDVNEARLPEQVSAYLSSFGTFNARRVRGLGSCPPPSHAASMREFGEMLFPVAKSLFDGARQIVLMPDGPLWSLPFDSLELPMSDGWRRLGDLAPVFVAPSIAALQQFRTQGQPSQPQTDGVLIVAEPLRLALRFRPFLARDVKPRGFVKLSRILGTRFGWRVTSLPQRR